MFRITRTILLATTLVFLGMSPGLIQPQQVGAQELGQLTITGQWPQNDTSDVDIGTDVTVTFSEPMDASSITGNISLATSDYTPVAAAVSLSSPDGLTATLDPTDDLAHGETYTVTVKGGSDGVKALSGNGLAADDSWTFTTAAPPQATGLTFTTPDQTLTAGETSGPITVELQDSDSQPVKAGADGVTVALSSDSASTSEFFTLSDGVCSTTPDTSVTIPEGSFSTSFCYRDTKVGTPTITASSTGLTDATQQETVTPAALHQLHVTTSLTGIVPLMPMSTVGLQVTAGTPFSVTVTAQDQYGNTVTDSRDTVHLALEHSDLGAILPADHALSSGTYTFSDGVTLKTAMLSQVIDASDVTTSGITGKSEAIMVNPAAVDAGQSTVTADPTSVAADDSTSSTITVTLLDAYSNPVGGKSVSLAANSEASASITAVDATTNDQGQATFTTKDSTAETVTYTATDTTDSVGITQTAEVTFTSTDTTPPTITDRVPAAGAADVAIYANIKVTFDEAMDESSLTDATVFLTKLNDLTHVPAVLSWDSASKTETLNPSADLAEDATYTVTVTTGVKDVAGNALDTKATWNFQTTASTGTVVKNTDDQGSGSLRQVIKDAQSGDTITFDPSVSGKTITLTSGYLLINKSLTIQGPGADKLTIDGNQASTVFDIASGTVTISGVTITGGKAYQGGGVRVMGGALTISHSTLSGNSADGGGGAIYNSDSGTLHVTDSTLSGNSASGPLAYGGAIENELGTVTVTRSTLTGNSAHNTGGAIDNFGGALTITDSTLSGNSTPSYSGAIQNESGGTVTVTGSTLTGNSADWGGAIYNDHTSTVSITNSTLTGSSAIWGGAIYNDGALHIISSTLAGNSASSGGGAIDNGGTVTIAGSIVAKNQGGNCYKESNSTLTDQGYNLEDGTDCGFTGTGSLQNTDPKLSSLADDDGPTQTMALQSGSPAIDAIPSDSSKPSWVPDKDQRGIDRPQANGYDIGAYEYKGPGTSTPTNTPVAPTDTPTATPTETSVPPTDTPTNTPTNTPVPPTDTPTSTTGDVVDQSQTAAGDPTNYPWVNSSYTAAQVFTAGQTGSIDQVSLYLKTLSSSGSLSVSIRTVDAATGYPTNRVLGSGSLNLADIPLDNAYHWKDVAINNAAVTTGTQYALVVANSGPSAVLADNDDSYSGGYELGYIPQGLGFVWNDFGKAYDLVFKTWVVPGLPGTLIAPGPPSAANWLNPGAFTLSWDPSLGGTGAITYTLQHKLASADDSTYVTVADTLSTPSYSFGNGGNAKEATGTWVYRVQATDGSTTTGWSATSDLIAVDAAPPTSTIDFPADGSRVNADDWSNSNGNGCWWPGICGTSSDPSPGASGVSKVEVSLKGTSGPNNGKYWNGSSWVTTPTWTAPYLDSFGGWLLDLALPADGTYTIQSRATDTVGNLQSPVTTNSFTIDTAAPKVSVNAPATNTTTPALKGTAGTAAGDLNSVTVNVYPGSSASGSPVASCSATAASNGAYSCTVSPALTSGSTYTAQARQSDAAGNTGLSATRTFTVSVNVAPVFTSQPHDVSIVAGNTATLIAAADGSTSYQWFSGSSASGPWSGIGGATSANYTTPTLTKVGTTYYYVQAKNTAGTTKSNTAAVIVTPGSATTLVLAAPATVTAGGSFTFTVTAKDQWGNTASDYAGTIHFTSSDGTASLPADSTLSNGTGSFSAALQTPGSQTITATDTVNTTITGSDMLTVVAAPTTSLALSGVPASIAAGSSITVTVTAKDQFGNIASGYRGKVMFSAINSTSQLDAMDTLPTYTFAAGDAGVHTFKFTLKAADTWTLTVNDTTNSLTAGAPITVTPGPLAKFLVVGPVSTVAGQPFSLTVSAADQYGNTVPSYAGTIHFTSSDKLVAPGTGLPVNHQFLSGDNGVHTFTAVLLKKVGNQSITVNDTVSTGIKGSDTISVAPAAASTFVVNAPGTVTHGQPFNFTVTAKDPYGNTATGYTGTVHFTSSDGAVSAGNGLPVDYTFKTTDKGVHTFSATLKTTGTRTITATDTNNSSIKGSDSIRVA